jgi:hypothetical protein
VTDGGALTWGPSPPHFPMDSRGNSPDDGVAMKLTLWALAGAGVVAAVLYYAAKPVAKLTFYDPEVIRAGAVDDPPTVIRAGDSAG